MVYAVVTLYVSVHVEKFSAKVREYSNVETCKKCIKVELNFDLSGAGRGGGLHNTNRARRDRLDFPLERIVLCVRITFPRTAYGPVRIYFCCYVLPIDANA